MDAEGELWLDIPGYEGRYMVSNHGRVKSLARYRYDSRRAYSVQSRYLKQTINKDGYRVVSLHIDGKAKTVTVHRLIAAAFIPNPNNLPCIDHIDGNRANNSLDNLRWVTHKENSLNMIRLGNKPKWENLNISEEVRRHFTQSQCKKVIRNDGQIFDSVISAARAIGYTNPRTVTDNLKGRREQVRGYSFAYL